LLGGDLQWLLNGLIVWAIVEQIILVYLVARFGEVKISISYIKTFILAALPLTIYAGSGMLAQVFDAWLVNYQYGSLSVFAIFKYGARELPGAIALASAFSATMIVSYASKGITGLTRIKEGSRRFMHVFFPISIALMLSSKVLFSLLYNVSFVESAMVFNTYLLIMVSRLLFPQAILIGMNKHSDVFIISLIELAVNIVLSLILIRYFGLVGVALGTALAFWLEKSIMISRLSIKYNIPVFDYAPTKVLLIYSILLVASYGIAWL
jgi:O-antigen/teichoic acid export membrane protein